MRTFLCHKTQKPESYKYGPHKTLLKKKRDNNVNEIEAIYDEYFKDVYKFILSLSKNPLVAEDVVQDTFIKALNNIKSLKDSSKTKSWLFQIAKNTYLTSVSKSIKTVSIGDVELASDNNEAAKFMDRDTAKAARKILHKMKEPYKEVFYLRIFANLSFKEIAEVFDKNEPWARQIFHRSKKLIKDKL